MLTDFAGRKLVPTTLDPIPPDMLTAPGVLAISHNDMMALEYELTKLPGSMPTFRRFIGICQTADAIEQAARPSRRAARR